MRNIKAHLNNPKLTKQMQKELKEFIGEYSRARKLSIPTQESYVRSLSFFGQFLADKRYSSFKEAKVEDIKEYLKDPYPRNHIEKSDSVIIWLKSSLKIFYRWLLLGRVGKKDKYPELVSWIEIGVARGRKLTDKDIISPEEFKKMLDATKNIRNRAMLQLLYETGIRLGELMSIRIEDVHFENDRSYIYITRSKTEPRTIFIFDSVEDVKRWLSIHPKKDDPKAYLFTNVNGKKNISMSYQSVLETIKRIGRRALGKKVWVHLFRHSAATNDARRGMPEDLMRLKYGWGKNSRMVDRYRHRNYEDVLRWEEGRRGIGEKAKDVQEAKKCYRCGKLNSWSNILCDSCGMYLDKQTFEKTLVFENLASKTIEEMQRKIAELEEKIEKLNTQK
ncbi:MAG: tyrosine-type recombinase/integrase [Candidatus Micrarchaeia archaeon]